MNNKTLNLYYKNESTIPLYITNIADEKTLFNYPNLVPNGDFDIVTTGSFDDWTYTNTYWGVENSVAYSGSSAKTSLDDDNIYRSLTSGSFAVNANTTYRASIRLKSDNGRVTYSIPNYNGIQEHYESLDSTYYAKIEWYNSASAIISSANIVEGSGEVDWTNYIKVMISPALASMAKLVVNAKCPTPGKYITQNSEQIEPSGIEIPIVYADNASILVKANVLLKSFEIETNTDFTFHPLKNLQNNVANYSFEYEDLTSGCITSWISDTYVSRDGAIGKPYWFRLNPNSFDAIQGYYVAGTSNNLSSTLDYNDTENDKHLPSDGITKTLTSASFVVTAEKLYNISLWFKSNDGKIKKILYEKNITGYSPPVYAEGYSSEGYNPDSGSSSGFLDYTPEYVSASIIYYDDYEYDAGDFSSQSIRAGNSSDARSEAVSYEPLRATYSASVVWYNGATKLSSDTIVMRTGGTPSRQFSTNKKSPATADNAKIVIGAYCPSFNTGTSGCQIILYPSVYADSVNACVNNNNFLTMAQTATFGTESELPITNVETEQIYGILVISSSAVDAGYTDCTGRNQGALFDSTGLILYAGCDENDSTSEWKSWIPFTCNFASMGETAASGIHVVSACLVVVAAESQAYVEDTPCRVKVGFDKTKNPPQPTQWSSLSSRTPISAYSGCITKSWVQGEEYYFNITNSAKKFFGQPDGTTDGITWNNGAELAIIVDDWGSDVGAYRSIVSTENNAINPDLPPPTLRITYANNFYEDEVYDTWLTSSSANWYQANYNSEKILVGSPNNNNAKPVQRGLIYVNYASSIPSNAIVTSACLCLYLETEQSSSGSYLCVYRMLQDWDLYTTTWRKKTGTVLWTNPGCSGGTEYDTALLGREYMTSSASATWLNINIDAETTGSWINGNYKNYGMLLKMGGSTFSEINDGRTLTSSQSKTIANRPYMKVEYISSGSYFLKTIQNTASIGGTVAMDVVRTAINTDLSFSGGAIYKISDGLKRYLLFYETDDKNSPSKGYHTSISIKNPAVQNSKKSFTKILQVIDPDKISVVVWGVSIPDDWDGGTLCTLEGTYVQGSNLKVHAQEFTGVDPNSPIYSSGSVGNPAYDNHTAATISLTSNADGYVSDFLSLMNRLNSNGNSSNLLPGSKQIKDKVVISDSSCYGISHYGKPITGTVTMSWTWQKGNYYVLTAIGLRPYSP